MDRYVNKVELFVMFMVLSCFVFGFVLAVDEIFNHKSSSTTVTVVDKTTIVSNIPGTNLTCTNGTYVNGFYFCNIDNIV